MHSVLVPINHNGPNPICFVNWEIIFTSHNYPTFLVNSPNTNVFSNKHKDPSSRILNTADE